MTELSRADAEAFVRAVVEITQMADRAIAPRRSPLTDRLVAHLGELGADLATTSITVPIVERVNVQLALDAYAAEVERFEVIGLQSDIGNYGGLSLGAMATGAWHGPGESTRQYVSAEIGVGETIDCLRTGLLLTEFDGAPVAALLASTDHHFPPELVLEVVGRERAVTDGFRRRLGELMEEHNAFRGKTVSFTFGRHGDFGLRFVDLPDVGRDDVILADGELAAIEAHAIGITEHADALRSKGQHVKRGLLLHGPPGTGKTHTIAYLASRMTERTTILLTGGAVAAVGQAGTIARSLQPATIIVEDVDLIALDRELPGGEHNALLFQLLNEMDGLAEDADVLFVLTTNRVDMLEPALAARPGRVDEAVEFSLPDAEARRRLLQLYVDGPLPSDVDAIVDRLDGTAPAFVKELARRAELVKLRGDDIGASALAVALEEMLARATPTLRRTLAGPGA